LSAAAAEVPRTKAANGAIVKQSATAAPAAPVLVPAEFPVMEIPVHLIVRSETNRQPNIDDDWVERIRREGVNSPILVRPIQATFDQFAKQPPMLEGSFAIGQMIYKLVYGERRWKGAERAGLKTIPGRIRELSDSEALKIQVRENEDREDYSPLDRADAYAHLHAQFMKDHAGEKGWTGEKCCALIAETCKNDKIKGRTVDQIVSLKTKLHEFCRAALRQEEMTQTHAYEIARRTEEEQPELLKWLRKETQHSQGDVPSVRRLKLEIKNMDIRADEKRRQELLFKPPQPGTATTKVPTVDDQLYAKAVSVATQVGKVNHQMLQRRLGISEAQAPALLTRLQESHVIGPIVNGSYWCIVPRTAPSQTVAKQPKPAGQLARAEQLAETVVKPKAKSVEQSNLEKIKISLDTERQVRTTAMEAIAKKAKLDRALVNEVLLEMLCVGEDAAALFAVKAFGWPKPNNGQHFSYVEIRKAGRKLIPKMKPNHVAALLLACVVQEDLEVYSARQECEKLDTLARLYKVNIGKIRKDLAAKATKHEPKAKGQGLKAGVRA
jgi:ParB/RepB/Spo0J family partition protein